MNKKSIVAVVLFAVLATMLVVYFFRSGREEKHFQWFQNYRADSDQPYGTKFIKELLADYRPAHKFTFNDNKPLRELLDTTAVDSGAVATRADYIFIGRELHLDDEDVKTLLAFVARGNNAFIASMYIPFDVVDPAYDNACDQELYLTENDTVTASFNFYHEKLKKTGGYPFTYRLGKMNYPYVWGVVNPDVFCDSLKSVVPLGYIDGYGVNFMKLPYGEGTIYMHTSPVAFTNYFLTHPDKQAYAASVFAHLNGDDIIWDEFSKRKFMNDNEPYSSPLSYFLEQPSLKYAWWTILAAALLYTLFAAKRRQRVIPVLEPKTNTSLEYVKMIAALHFQNGNNLDIARKKMKYFLYFVRSRYGIYTQHLTDEHMKRLAEKSKIDLEHIRHIFSEYQQMDRNLNPASDRLVRLYSAIDHFYKHCK